MKKTHTGFVRTLALLLTVAMLVGLLPMGVLAAPKAQDFLKSTDVSDQLSEEERLRLFQENMDPDKVSPANLPSLDEEVRVIVELDAPSLLDVKQAGTWAAAPMADFLETDEAQDQLLEIQAVQLDVLSQMEAAGIESQLTYSYTAVAGGFAAKMAYGDVAAVSQMDGVRRVSLCDIYYPDVVGESTLGEALTDAEVAAYANSTDYQGEGMVIGVIDTGLDWTHAAFGCAPELQKLTPDSLKKMAQYDFTYGDDGAVTGVTAYSYAGLWYAQANSGKELVLLQPEDLYKSEKVPFAFDYADGDTNVIPTADAVERFGNDHGTHVAGIAAGKAVDENGQVTFAGQAPEAQLAIFKVFSDSSSGASTDTVLAALNDAVLLGVDAINMSLGSSGGFSAEDPESPITTYYNAVKAYGILLNCSAGNAYSSSYGGAQSDYSAASDPDTGIIGSAGSYGAALAVASINAAATPVFSVGGQKVPFHSVTGHDFVAELLDGQDSASFEYVMVPGTGDKADYEGLDVTGKIAVVIRGDLSFNDKQRNAAAAGAAGCVIYNNKDGYLLNMAVDDYAIPTASISYPGGVMMDQQAEKVLSVSAQGSTDVEMSDFSSWGPLPSLELKPEITGPGGSIYSSLPFGQYGLMSGTSMSSPYVAGTSAAAMQYVRRMFPGMDAQEQRALVNQLMMSTADILYDGSGTPYSPRRQGAGMVDLAAVVNTPAYLYVKGSDKTKIELGDDPGKSGVYSLSFQVKNLTGSDLRYDVNTLVQTESVGADGKFIAQAGHALDAATEMMVYGGSMDGDAVTVPAYGEASVVITVTLSQEARDYMDHRFENGIYVEGFVELSNENDPSLSIPYLAFYGDWTQAPIFEDADFYNGEPVKMYPTTPAGVYAMMYVFPLGVYPFNAPEGCPEANTGLAQASLDLGSGNGISNLYYLQAGMLRGAKNVDMVISDADTGEIVHSASILNTRKAYRNTSTGEIRPGMVGDIWPSLTGYSPMLPSGTRLHYSVTAALDDSGAQKNKNNRYAFDFTSDSEMPWVVNRNSMKFYYGDDGRVYLDVVMADNFALAGATLYSAVWQYDLYGNYNMTPGSNYYGGVVPAVQEDGSAPGAYEEHTFTFDVTDFYKKLTDGCFYILAYDYAMNECCLRISLDEIPVTEIKLDTAEATLPIRGNVMLSAAVVPDNATNQAVTWTTSDASVAEVRAGLVKAVAPGTATITVTAKGYPEISASCDITVTEEMGPDIPMTAFTLNKVGQSLTVGEVNTVVELATYTPYTATNLEVTWSSDDPAVAAVDEATGAITGVSAGTCVVTAKAVLGDASASVNVTVKPGVEPGQENFAIDGDVLVGYSGSAETVTVPDGIRVIGEKAFNANKTVKHVVLPATVEEIGMQAFYNCENLASINLPEAMVSLGEKAFYGCKKLETLGLDDKGVIPKGLTELPVSCFFNCNALRGDLVIPDGVTTICQEAFYGCKALTSIAMADSVVSWGDGYGQFNGCISVASIDLSESVTALPRNCFFDCRGLTDLPDLKNVTELGQACFQHCEGLTEITIPAQITTFAGNVFYSCDILETVHFEGSPAAFGTSVFYACKKLTTVDGNLTTIGETMFQDCDAMVNFVVPDHVTSIGKNAFRNCDLLETITFPASYCAETLSMGEAPFLGCKVFQGIVIEDGCEAVKLVDGAIYTGDGKKLVALPQDFAETELVIPEGVEEIGDAVFMNNKTIASVTFPSTLKKIGEKAFYQCPALTAAVLPDGVTAIGSNAFYKCTALAELRLGRSLTTVEPYAFYGDAKITAIDLPDPVTSVGEYAFYGCNAAERITIPQNVASMGKYAFYGCKKAESILLPQSLTEMGVNAFYDCNAATEISTGGLTVIPANAFQNCKAVQKITLGDDVTALENNAFYYCQVLEEINWPSALETVGNGAFYFCRMLQDLDLSGTQICSIGTNAFYQAYEARTLVFPETLESIDSRAFAYLNYGRTSYVRDVFFPAGATSIHKEVFYYANGLQNILVDENNPVYTAADGILILRETGELYLWPMANTTTEFTFPENMTEVPARMFQNNTSLKKVIFHSGVTYIGVSAFSNSHVEEFVFARPANGLAIDSSAFSNCDSLTEITLPYGTTAINNTVFNGCDRLEKAYLPDTVTFMGNSTFAYDPVLTQVHLSAGLSEMPDSTFSHCTALEEITLPAGMRTCGVTNNHNAFAWCENLKNIWAEPGSRYLKSVEGVLYDANGKTLRVYPMGRTDEHYAIPEGTIRVGSNAALGNPHLKSVSFPSTLVRVGDMAFYNCTNLKDLYFNGMTAPVLETDLTATGGTSNYACYWNFVDQWMTVDSTTHKVVPNSLGLNLYYPQGAKGFTGYVWRIYFQSGSTNVMDASYFTVTGLAAVEAQGRTVDVSWEEAKKSGAEAITYKVERSVATHIVTDSQNTWLYEEFVTLADSLTQPFFHDDTALDFGLGYAYRVSAYNEKGETGPAAVATIEIRADAGNDDEVAAQAVIQAIEALKPIENLSLADKDRLEAIRAMYDALTDTQKEMVVNLPILEEAFAWVAMLEAQQKLPFTDVSEEAWNYDAIKFVYQNGLMNGTKPTLFAPEENLSRGMMIAVLYRMAGSPDCTGSSSFTDVDPQEYYAEAVNWAVELGLTNGYPDGTFRPDAPITRAEMATFLYRYATIVEGKAPETTQDALKGYADSSSVPDYARIPMAWAVENGVINGVGGGKLAPAANALREQLAAILYRYCTQS